VAHFNLLLLDVEFSRIASACVPDLQQMGEKPMRFVIGSMALITAAFTALAISNAAAAETRICQGEAGNPAPNNCNGPGIESIGCEEWTAKFAPPGLSNEGAVKNVGETYCKYTENGQQKVSPYRVNFFPKGGGGKCGYTLWHVECLPPK
jgi:hypothetical protein